MGDRPMPPDGGHGRWYGRRRRWRARPRWWGRRQCQRDEPMCERPLRPDERLRNLRGRRSPRTDRPARRPASARPGVTAKVGRAPTPARSCTPPKGSPATCRGCRRSGLSAISAARRRHRPSRRGRAWLRPVPGNPARSLASAGTSVPPATPARRPRAERAWRPSTRGPRRLTVAENPYGSSCQRGWLRRRRRACRESIAVMKAREDLERVNGGTEVVGAPVIREEALRVMLVATEKVVVQPRRIVPITRARRTNWPVGSAAARQPSESQPRS